MEDNTELFKDLYKFMGEIRADMLTVKEDLKDMKRENYLLRIEIDGAANVDGIKGRVVNLEQKMKLITTIGSLAFTTMAGIMGTIILGII